MHPISTNTLNLGCAWFRLPDPGPFYAVPKTCRGTGTVQVTHRPLTVRDKPVRITDPATGPPRKPSGFRFSTKRTCNTTDLVLYEYRVYNPSTGRWLSRDPMGENKEQNLYLFVRNNASRGADPFGLYYLPYPFPRFLPECRGCKCRSVTVTINPNGRPLVFPGTQPGTVLVGFPVMVSVQVYGDISLCKCKHQDKGTVTLGYPNFHTVDISGEREISCTYRLDAPGYDNIKPPPTGQASEQYRFAYNLTITVTCIDSDGKSSISGSGTLPGGPFWFVLQTDQSGITRTVPTPPRK